MTIELLKKKTIIYHKHLKSEITDTNQYSRKVAIKLVVGVVTSTVRGDVMLFFSELTVLLAFEPSVEIV